MIIEGLFNLISGILSLIPFDLPQLPEKFQTLLTFVLDNIKNSIAYLNLFIDLKFWLICACAMTIIINIKHIYNTFIWLLNFIPSFNISFWK